MTAEKQMTINSDNCTGCLLCGLACSVIKHRLFNPTMAYIQVKRDLHKGPFERYSVEFTDACDNCGFCVDFCAYEALTGSLQAASLK